MKFYDAIDLHIADMCAQGRLNSASSERGYRATLVAHAKDIGNRDPAKVGRDDVKRTLRRWLHPNTQGTNRSKLVSFYAWAMEEGPVNPSTHLRGSAKRGVAGAPRPASTATRAHSRSADIAKGGRERWVPVITDLAAVIDEIRTYVCPDEFVLPAQRARNPGLNTERIDYARIPSSSQALRQLVMRVSERAEITEHIRPHDLRHAFADHIARGAGAQVAQHMLGHAHLGTTDTYLGVPLIDEIVLAVSNISYGIRTNVLGGRRKPRYSP